MTTAWTLPGRANRRTRTPRQRQRRPKRPPHSPPPRPADAPAGQPEAPTGATAAKANRDKLVQERRALVAQIQAILDSPECTLKAAKKAKLMAGIDESTGEAWEMADTLTLTGLVRL